MQNKFRKLMALCLAAALFVTSMATGLIAMALGATNLLADLTLSDTTGVTMDAVNNGFTVSGNSATPIYFNNLTLEKNSTYEYSFDITFHSAPTGQIVRLALRDGGQWFNFIGAWGQQGRFNDTNDINPLIGLLSLSLQAETTYNFKFQLEPTRARLLIDGVAQVNTAGNTDAEGWTTLPAVKDGKIGIDVSGGVNLTMSNVTLVKTVQGSSTAPEDVIAAINAIGDVDAYSREKIATARALYDELSADDQALVTNIAALNGAEAAFAGLNLLAGLSVSSTVGAEVNAATNSVKVTCGNTPIYFNNLTLDKESTYVYEFDMIYHGPYNATFPWLILRDGGQYINAGAYGCIRVCDNLNFDDFEANAAMSANAGIPVSFKIIMEPRQVKAYINGKPVGFGGNTGVNVVDGYVPVPAVENGKLGVTGGNTGFTYTMSNISLTKVGVVVDDPAVAATVDAITAIGTVTAYSRDTIKAARKLFDALTPEQQAKVPNASALTEAESAFAAMNLLKDLTVSNTDAAVVNPADNSVKITAGSTVYFNNLKLNKNSTYVYEFDITYDGAFNATFPWLLLREGGQYVSLGCYGQMRVCDVLNFDDFEAWSLMSATAGQPISLKIIMEPERIKVYINGQAATFTPNVNVTLNDDWISLPAVKNAKFGVAGGNPGFTYTLSNLSLAEIPGEPDGEDANAAAVQAVVDAINAIGKVDAASGQKIEAARKAYDELTPELQAQVTNADVLTEAETAYKALNLLASATLTSNGVATYENGTLTVDGSLQEAGGVFYFDGITLRENATYVYAFDLTMKAPVNTNLVTMALRDDGTGKTGQFLGFWGSTNQVRICKTSDTNTFVDIYNPFGLEANKTYSFRIVMAQDRVQIYVDGILRKGALCADPDGWTTLSSVKDGLLGIYYDLGTNITMENMWLAVMDAEDIAAAEAVDALINTIGKVTLNSDAAIQAAEKAYADLTDNQRGYVTAYATLAKARADYDLLVAQDQASAEDKAAAKSVMDKIDAIGNVTTSSKAAIEAAESAYAVLTDSQKVLVTNYDTLTTARTTYENAVKAENVDNLIAAIGKVGVGSQPAILIARSAYDALTDIQKAMVKNLVLLEKAEKDFAALGGTKDVYYYYPSTNDLMGANYWPNNVMQSEISTGGIHYRWFNAGTDWRTALNIPLDMDGLHLTFGNIAFTSEAKQFAVYLADKDAQEAYTASSKAPLIFIFNCETGELKVTSESKQDAGVTIIQAEALKAENLAGKQVELKLTANGDGYTVNMLGQTGVITKAMLDAAEALTDYSKAYITLCPWNWAAAAQVEFDLLAVHGGELICSDDLSADQLAAIDAVIEKIDAIDNEITDESEPAIIVARAAYDALGSTEQGFVSNYKVLVNAEWKLQSLKAEGGMDFKDKNYYRPSRSQTMGTNYWTNNLFISDLAEGGIHFEWNMTGTDWRMGIDKELTFDGMHLVFDGLKFSSANKRFAVYIGDLRDSAEDWGAGYSSVGNQPLMIVFDGNNGLVKACTENMVDPAGTVLIESPALLAENLEGKEFDLKITANGDGTYTLSVLGMEAILTKELLDSAIGLTEYDEVYVTLCPWDWTTSTVMELNLIAIHSGKEICADDVTPEVLAEINGTIETIKAIFNEKGQVTPASRKTLIKARELYEALDDYVKGVVENYQDLVDAEEIYEIVEAIAGIGTVTVEKADAIAILNDMYKALEPYKRPMVGNYLTLRDALLDVYLLQRGEKEDGTIPGTPDNNDGPTSPITGESSLTLVLALMTAITAAGVMLVSKQKNKKAL
ncbi:MAG: hypothetical protein IJ518_05865 [Clostridia bacterium]|nr:hypothetical protein [Clostridia bacterium]